MKWSKETSWKTHHHSDSSFIYPRDYFINNPIRGIDYLKKHIVPFLQGGETIVTKEIVYQKNALLEKFKNSKILILGGGPTTVELEWSESNYDFLWSTNHFFLNEKIKDTNISLATIGDEVKFSNQHLHEYLESNNTILCFENIGRSQDELVNFKKKYNQRVFWAHTRYHSKIGAIPRLIVMAVLLGVQEIDIVGMDGVIPNHLRKIHRHSFEKDKERNGTLELLQEKQMFEKYSNQFLVLWDYLLHDIGKDVKFRNLGHGHPCNISTQVLTGVLGEGYQRYLLDRSS